MRGRRIFRVLKVVAIVIVGFTVFGFVVTHLWNYLMPGLFGLRTITFWQAVGLMVLGGCSSADSGRDEAASAGAAK